MGKAVIDCHCPSMDVHAIEVNGKTPNFGAGGFLVRQRAGKNIWHTRLSDRFGALLAIKDKKFLFVTHGKLAAITIDKSEYDSWQSEIERRPRYGKTEAGWFDRDKGEVKFEGGRLCRATGSGSIALGCRPDIMADAPINATGF